MDNYTKQKEIVNQKIYVCGYCDEVITEKTITRHLKKIHNVTQPVVTKIITKVVML